MKKWVLTASLGLEVANASDFLSFSSIDKPTGRHLIQVLEIENNEVTYVDLSTALKLKDSSPFLLFKNSTFEEQQKRLVPLKANPEKIAYSELKNPLQFKEQHLCAGLNYSDHAEESGQKNQLVLFPKIGNVVGNNTKVLHKTNSALPELLDYEVELGLVFDRDLNTPEDIDKSIAGLLVTNDFSDRSPQILYFGDVDQHESYSFTAAKSKKDYTLVGPIVTIPKDWKNFVKNLEIRLYVNGVLKQKSSTSKMSLPIEAMLKSALEDKAGKKWPLLKEASYEIDPKGEVALLPTNSEGLLYLPSGSIFMTGTPAGTLFQKPSFGELIKALLLIPLTQTQIPKLSFKKKLKVSLIENLSKSGLYLKSGDRVETEIENLGILRFSIE